MSRISRNLGRLEALSETLEKLVDKMPQIRNDVGVKLANAGWDEANGILQDHVWSGETIGSLTAEIGENRTFKASSMDTFLVYMESPAAMFVEFGAGVIYGAGHPFAAELGMGPGTFPGQTHAFNPNGWWFKTDDPKLATKTDRYGYYWHHSYGNPPHMPMYHAARAVVRKAPQVAAEVVRSVLK